MYIFTIWIKNFRSCYRIIEAALATKLCTATTTGTPFTTAAGLLGFDTGRRKRREAEKEILIQNPISKIGEQEQMLSYRDYIDATKVSPSNKYCLAQ